MKLIIVPHSSSRDSARLWLAAVETETPPSDLQLTIQERGVLTVPEAAWRPVTAGGALQPSEARTFVQTLQVDGLAPGTRYVVHGAGTSAQFATLPARLPRAGDRPFNVLLSSCFYSGRDGGRAGLAIGAAIRNLPEGLQPDVKFLSGDQVYLDFPSFVVGLPITTHGLGRSLLGKYLTNWSDENGYQQLLRQGASYFTADDHEFWNNYPNAATLISNTWTAGGRQTLKTVTLSLLQDFQCERPELAGRTRSFIVGRLSFFVADTRVGREPGDDRFMPDDDLAALVDWLDTLEGPGVLVVGQPLFEPPANWFSRRVVDRALSNYRQYREVVRGLSRARHSVLLLTGDVHYPRIVTASFRRGADLTDVHEVIASPAALVFGNHADPKRVTRFPPSLDPPLPDVPQAETIRQSDALVGGDHFAVLSFSEVPGVVRVDVRHIYVGARARTIPPQTLTLI